MMVTFSIRWRIQINDLSQTFIYHKQFKRLKINCYSLISLLPDLIKFELPSCYPAVRPCDLILEASSYWLLWSGGPLGLHPLAWVLYTGGVIRVATSHYTQTFSVCPPQYLHFTMMGSGFNYIFAAVSMTYDIMTITNNAKLCPPPSLPPPSAHKK